MNVSKNKYKIYEAITQWIALREQCSYSEFLWSVFSRIWTEYGAILRISPYSVRMRENTDQKNSEYSYFLRSVGCSISGVFKSTK